MFQPLQRNIPPILSHTTSTSCISQSSTLSPKQTSRTQFAKYECSWTPPSPLRLALDNFEGFDYTGPVFSYPILPTSPCYFTSTPADPQEISSSSYPHSPLYNQFNLSQVAYTQQCESSILLFANEDAQEALIRALEFSSIYSMNAVENMQESSSCLLTNHLTDPIHCPVAKRLPLIPLPEITLPADITIISTEEPMSINECVDVLSVHKSLEGASFHCVEGLSTLSSIDDMAQRSLVPFLESLNLCSDVDVGPLFERLHFQGITRLTLAGHGGNSDISSLNIPWGSITHLALSYDMTISVLKKLLDYCTNLQSFDYNGRIISVEKPYPSLIPIHAPALSHLKVSHDSAGYKTFINSLFSFKSNTSLRSIDVPQLACLHTIERKITDIIVRNPVMMKECLDIISKHTLLESAEFTLTDTEIETEESEERLLRAYRSIRPTLKSLKFNAGPQAERLLASLQLSSSNYT